MTNKFRIAYKLLFGISIFLLVVMIIATGFNYNSYVRHPEWSAPFYAYVFRNIFLFGVPAIFLLVLSLALKMKANK